MPKRNRKMTSLEQWVFKKPKEKPAFDSDLLSTESRTQESQALESTLQSQSASFEMPVSITDSIEQPSEEQSNRTQGSPNEPLPPVVISKKGDKVQQRGESQKQVAKFKQPVTSKNRASTLRQPRASKNKTAKLALSFAPKTNPKKLPQSKATRKIKCKLSLPCGPQKSTDKLPLPTGTNMKNNKIPLQTTPENETDELTPQISTENKQDEPLEPLPTANQNEQLPPPMVTKTKTFNFQPVWLTDFPWTELNEERTKMFCKTCRKAHSRNIFTSADKVNYRFISGGYTNWQLATKKLSGHERSKQHVDATTKLDAQKKQPIAPIMDDNLKKSQLESRVALKAIVTSVKYLTQQGLAVRGHDHQDGNFQKLLQLRSKDVPALLTWLKRNSTYTSMDCQNEIIRTISHKIQRRLLHEIRERKEFSLIIDETSDLSGREQVSICVRTVDEELVPQENFLGLYEVGSTTGEDLTNVIFDFLRRSGLSITNLRGQCYDGAKNMSGAHRGVAKRISDEQPLATFVHCYAHSLNLAIQDTVNKIPLIRDTLAVIHEISVIVKASPKRLAQFKEITSQQDTSTGLVPKPLCPTRFLHRVRSIRAVLENYDGLLEQLEHLSSSHEQVSSSANGLFTQLLRGEVYFTMVLCLELFKYLENLSRQIQKPSNTLSGILEAVNLVKRTLAGHSKDEEPFQSMFEQMKSQIRTSSLEDPKLPRKRKFTPKVQKDPAPVHKTVEEFLRSIYQNAYKMAEEELNFRFNQNGIFRYIKMENMVLKPGELNSQEVLEFCQMYSINVDKLETNLKTLKYSGEEFKSVDGVVKYMKGLQSQSRALFGEVIKVLKLLLLFPVSSCTAERSFSVLKLVKTHLRTTMLQERLNHCVLIHTYAGLVDDIDDTDIMREFINNERRLSI